MYLICNHKNLNGNTIATSQPYSQDSRSAMRERKWIERINIENKENVVMCQWHSYLEHRKTQFINIGKIWTDGNVAKS